MKACKHESTQEDYRSMEKKAKKEDKKTTLHLLYIFANVG